jgi:hypothetical protein
MSLGRVVVRIKYEYAHADKTDELTLLGMYISMYINVCIFTYLFRYECLHLFTHECVFLYEYICLKLY